MLTAMSDQAVPPEIVALAEERSRARAERDWHAADELRGRVEAAGWRIEDRDLDFRLSPARPPDIVEAGRTVYGSPDAVPSLADEPDAPGSAVVLLSVVAGSPTAMQLAALSEHVPAGTRLLVTAPQAVDAAVLTLASEIVWTVEPWPVGAALRAALRRVTNSTMVVLGERTIPGGDVVTPLVAALADETVAVAGSAGLVSADLWQYQAGAPGEVTVVTADCYAFRRQDALVRGPVDDRLLSPGGVSAWLSLVLRDTGAAVSPRRAVAVELPLQPLSPTAPLHGKQPPLARRDRYRVAERFKGRTDLAHRGAAHEAPRGQGGTLAR